MPTKYVEKRRLRHGSAARSFYAAAFLFKNKRSRLNIKPASSDKLFNGYLVLFGQFFLCLGKHERQNTVVEFSLDVLLLYISDIITS